MDAARERITGLKAELETAAQRNTDLVEEVKVLSERVRGERDKTGVGGRVGASSSAQCRPQAGGRITARLLKISSKEERIEDLESQIAALETTTHERGSRELHAVPGRSASGGSLVAAGLPPPHDSDGVRHARRESSITGRDVSVTTRSPSAREPSRPADRGKLQMSQASTPLVNTAPVKRKPNGKPLLALQKPFLLGKSQSYPCRGSAKGQSASSRIVQWRDNLTIGTHHSKELQIGTNGLTKTPLSNWPVTCVAVPFKNGPCSEKRRKKH